MLTPLRIFLGALLVTSTIIAPTNLVAMEKNHGMRRATQQIKYISHSVDGTRQFSVVYDKANSQFSFILHSLHDTQKSICAYAAHVPCTMSIFILDGIKFDLDQASADQKESIGMLLDALCGYVKTRSEYQRLALSIKNINEPLLLLLKSQGFCIDSIQDQTYIIKNLETCDIC